MSDIRTSTAGESALADPPTGSAAPPPKGWVPPDQRVLGLDRRSFWPAFALIVIWLVWAHAMPWINEQIELDAPIVAGDVIDLGGGEYTYVPAVGWNLEAGVLVQEGERSRASVPATGVVATDGLVYKARSAPWDGTPDELVDQMIDLDERLNVLVAADERGRSDITNFDGVPGRLTFIVTDDEAVLLVTYVFPASAEGATPVGIEIEVAGTPAAIREHAEEIARMIDSTRFTPVAEEAQP